MGLGVTHKQAGPDRRCHGNGAVESETGEGNGGEDAGHRAEQLHHLRGERGQ